MITAGYWPKRENVKVAPAAKEANDDLTVQADVILGAARIVDCLHRFS
jgi:hypothetical protein